MKLFWILLTGLARAILSLRYTVEIKGLENVSAKSLQEHKGGIFFMPNHPALMDPLFISLILWPRFRMRPLVTEYIYRQSFMRRWMLLTKGIPVPSLSQSVNAFKVKKAKEAIQAVADGLKNNEHFILYPGGRLKTEGYETMGGSSGAHEILQQCPNAKVVLIRTTGLWGSSFSRAILGVSPDFRKTAYQGVKTIFKNLIFFAPRRKIVIEIEKEPEDFPRGGSRLEFNRFLENWYNQYPDEKGNRLKEEPLKLVSYAFWKKDLPAITQVKTKKSGTQTIPVDPETLSLVTKEIQTILSQPKLAITPTSSLTTDLGMDSLNIAELIAFLSQKFDTEEIHPEDLSTVQDALEAAQNSSLSKENKHIKGTFQFPQEPKRPDPTFAPGTTIQEAFLHSCKKMGNFVACGDDVVGPLRYRKLQQSALVLSSYFKTLPETHIAILLPASCAAYILIFAILLAGKVPVMLNWTLGPKYLDHMMQISGAKTAISSWKFIEKLSHVDFGNMTDSILFLEDIRSRLKLKWKLRGLFLSLLPTPLALRSLGLHKESENNIAVILFTSGTEASPKGVPLSHKNLLTNQRGTFNKIPFYATDTMYGILPPFHSFGFSVAGILPILSGMRIAFFPDPTDGFALAEGVNRWKVTIFCGAPNFLKGLMTAAKPEQLQSMRLFVSGAEKPPISLLELIAKIRPEAPLLEGYGITECAPVLTARLPQDPTNGVGFLLEGIEGCTIHPETQAPLPSGSEGEICVNGPNVFQGYLGTTASPFIEIEGKKWYRTGDIGYFEKSGNLVLSGRLKRFIKLGGEMVSLGAIEEVLSKELLAQGQGNTEAPSIAVCALELPDQKPKIIVFTTSNELSRESANEILSKAGLSRLIKIESVQKINEIPLLGTGKTNYLHLQTLIPQ